MLLSSVMKVAFEAATLVVLRGDEALSRTPEIVEARLQIGG
jgi:hypothetical protein